MSVKFNEMANLVNPTISIDQYKPKIGEASETVVVAFEVDSEQPASDLANLLETDVVEMLDVDVSQGPNKDGKHLVFVEFARDNRLHSNILDIMHAVSSATGISEWQFDGYKSEVSSQLDEDNLSSLVLDNPQDYVLKYADKMEESSELLRLKTLSGI
jgi:hypothetical protein